MLKVIHIVTDCFVYFYHDLQYAYPPDRRSMPAGLPVQAITSQSLQGKTVSSPVIPVSLHQCLLTTCGATESLFIWVNYNFFARQTNPPFLPPPVSVILFQEDIVTEADSGTKDVFSKR